MILCFLNLCKFDFKENKNSFINNKNVDVKKITKGFSEKLSQYGILYLIFIERQRNLLKIRLFKKASQLSASFVFLKNSVFYPDVIFAAVIYTRFNTPLKMSKTLMAQTIILPEPLIP
ncbi:MAG: hypothetical protein K2P93_01405 [Alphaproteobacteria bacterium]|nr:hypothetical protein [Alphaproteobacteria bacterium]